MKRPRTYVPPICKEDKSWARCNQNNVETYACHLKRVFQPNNIASELDIVHPQLLNEIREKIKQFTSVKIAKEFDTKKHLFTTK